MKKLLQHLQACFSTSRPIYSVFRPFYSLSGPSSSLQAFPRCLLVYLQFIFMPISTLSSGLLTVHVFPGLLSGLYSGLPTVYSGRSNVPIPHTVYPTCGTVSSGLPMGQCLQACQSYSVFRPAYGTVSSGLPMVQCLQACLWDIVFRPAYGTVSSGLS